MGHCAHISLSRFHSITLLMCLWSLKKVEIRYADIQEILNGYPVRDFLKRHYYSSIGHMAPIEKGRFRSDGLTRNHYP